MKRSIKAIATLIMSGSLLASCGNDKYITFASQLDALNQLSVGSVQVAIIDSVMARYYTSNGSLKDKVSIVPDLYLAKEQYGIAAKKGNDSLIQNINKTLYSLFDSGDFQTIAEKYSLGTADYTLEAGKNYEITATDDSYQEVMASKKVVIGYTVFAPIAYTDTSTNKLTGFDIDLARKVFATWDASIDVEFTVIDWDAKEALLSNGTINLIWNGLTITEDRLAGMSISVPYLNNNQVAVVNTADLDKYDTKEKIAQAVIGVEKGSAGEDVAKELTA